MQYQIGDWLVNTIETSITHLQSQERVKLEPIAIELLTLLAKNSGQIVTREELFEKIWNGRVISDHAIYRVITKLRKALSPNDKNAYIVTVSKRGYKLIKDYQEIELNKSIVKQTSITEQPKTPFNKKTTYVAVLAIAAIGIIGLFFATQTKTPTITEYKHTKPVTAKQGIESNPIYYDENKQLLFTWQKNNNEPSNIYKKNLADDVITPITTNPFIEGNLTASDDGKTIAFTRKDNKKCEVIRLKFIANKKPEENSLFACDTLFADLELSNDGETLYYINKSSGSYQIFSHSLNTGKKEQLTKINQSQSLGEFNIALSPDNSKLAFIRRPNWNSSTVGFIDTTTLKETSLFKVNQYIDSLAWSKDNKNIYYKSTPKSVSMYSLDSKESSTVITSLESEIRTLYNSPYENSVLAEKHNITQNQGIWLVANPLENIGKPESKPYIQSSDLDLYPSFANLSDRIAFMSMRSGTQQIWIKEEDGTERRLTSFTDDRGITQLSWSPDDRLILSDGGNEIYSIDVETGEKIVHLKKDSYGNSGSAVWSMNAKKIYFYSSVSGDFQIYSLEIDTKKVTQISTRGATVAFTSFNPSIIYLLKSHYNGLWQLNLDTNEETLLFEDINDQSFDGVEITKDRIYYHSAISNSLRYYDLKSQSSHTIQLQHLPELPQFSLSKNSLNFAFSKSELTESSILLISKEQLNH